MSQYKVTKQLFLDALPPAAAIETHLSEYLTAPPPGMYLAGHTEPTLLVSERYHQLYAEQPGDLRLKREELKDIANLDLSTVKGDIYDTQDRLVLRRSLVKELLTVPTVPVRGLAAVATAVDWAITYSSAWAKRPAQSIQEALAKHVQAQYAQTEDLLDQLAEFLRETRQQVVEFIGDDKWVVHFHSTRGAEIVVEKTIDFRILDWERRINSGEWK